MLITEKSLMTTLVDICLQKLFCLSSVGMLIFCFVNFPSNESWEEVGLFTTIEEGNANSLLFWPRRPSLHQLHVPAKSLEPAMWGL